MSTTHHLGQPRFYISSSRIVRPLQILHNRIILSTLKRIRELRQIPLERESWPEYRMSVKGAGDDKAVLAFNAGALESPVSKIDEERTTEQ